MQRECPGYRFEVKKEARLHSYNPNTAPYGSTADAVAKFPETVTAIGARMDEKGEIAILAPHGVGD